MKFLYRFIPLFICLIVVGFIPVASSQSCNVNHTLGVLNDPYLPYSLVAAHRGSHKNAPENSLPSIDEAVALGADIIELDVRLTQDNVAVLLHDFSLDRTTNGKGKIIDWNFNDVAKLNLKARQGGRRNKLTTYKVPTLRQALNSAKGRIWFHIDLKSDSDEAIAIIAGDVRKSGMENAISLYHKSAERLTKVKQHLPNVVLVPMGDNAEQAITLAKTGMHDIVHTKPDYMTAQHTYLLNGLKSSGWVNALKTPDKLASNGQFDKAYLPYVLSNVDIIQTDEPELLINYLEKKGRRVLQKEFCR